MFKNLTPKLVFSLASAVIGSAFQFGYNTGVINSPSKLIKDFINETDYKRKVGNDGTMEEELMTSESIEFTFSVIVAIFGVGGCIGGISNGFLADKFGRKTCLLFNNILAIIGALLMGLSKAAGSYEMIIIGRFFIGLNCGLNSGLCPIYITEIAPVAIRGSVGTLFQLGAVSTIFLSQILGLPELLLTESLWPLLLGFTGIFAVFQLATLPFCPESPRFLLIKRGQKEEAEKALIILRNNREVSNEIDEMTNEANLEKSIETFKFFNLFTTKALLLPTVISIVLHLSQQFSGINAVFYYSTDILRDSGISSPEYATPFVGLVLVLTTIVSIPLMEFMGRRFLHLLGLSGMFVFSILMTIATVLKEDNNWIKYVNLISMYLYIMFFAIGPGSIPWMIVGEFFTQGPRAAVISLAVLVNWTANVLVGLGFPTFVTSVTKDWTFAVFVVLLLGFIIFTFLFLPETKGKSAEEMSTYFRENTFAFKKQNQIDSKEESAY